MSFLPIAIVGRACLLPGARTPSELADLVFSGRDALSSAPADRWGMSRARVMGDTRDTSGDRTWSDRGGYVDARALDADGYGIPAADVRALDPLFRWVLAVARDALADAGPRVDRARTGAILGNLSFPTVALADLAAHAWLAGSPLAGSTTARDPRNRFSSGLPVHLLDRALGVRGPRFALDAACASSLYSVALACRALADGQADWMLAGAVNCADDLFIHVGFCALQAMSKTGRCRPFHADADGLVPAEGCAMLVLRRLSDAVKAGDRILGVIRGVGLSNDGRGRGLLSPHEDGQIRAMRAAWTAADIDPRSAAYVECHATGTPVGDATELRSLAAVFSGRHAPLPIGSLKGNLGHPVTAAGTAGILKVLAAFERDALPPTPHGDRPSEALDASRFRVVREVEPWPKGSPKLAAVSAFGFGGNDAHVVLEACEPSSEPVGARTVTLKRPSRVAITAIGARVGAGGSALDFAHALADRTLATRRAEEVRLSLAGLRFPPADLEHTNAQQTMLLAAAREAADAHGAIPSERTAMISGMGVDCDVARWGARWRVADRAAALGADEAWIESARDAIAPALRAATVVGTMPNVPANRVSSQLDLRGPSYTVAAEERSGLVALRIARRMLEEREIDCALVGASDLSDEPVHAAAAAALLPEARRTPGDAAVVLVVERESDARAAGRPILALLPDDFARPLVPERVLDLDGPEITLAFGHAHAASGLVHVAAAALALRHGLLEVGRSTVAVGVRCSALEGEQETLVLERPAGAEPVALAPRVAPADAPPRALVLRAHPPAIVLPPLARRVAASPLPASTPTPTPRRPEEDASMRDKKAASHAHGARRMAPPPWLPATSAPAPAPPLHAATSTSAAASSAQRAPAPAPSRHAATSTSAAISSAQRARATSAAVLAAPAAGGFDEALAALEVGGADPPAAWPVAGDALAWSPEGAAALGLAEMQRAVADAHRAFLSQQVELHTRFLTLREHALGALAQAAGAGAGELGVALPDLALSDVAPTSASAWSAPAQATLAAPAPRAAFAPPPVRPAPATAAAFAPPPAAPAPAVAKPVVAKPGAAKPGAAKPNASTATGGLRPDPFRMPLGPTFDREQLKIDASGRISEIFGPAFAPQDPYAVQTRMPMEPMLLADRVIGIDATPAAMTLPPGADPKGRKGTVWTETDVRWDSWWLHQGRMPGGILIESGQADLFLISYLGVDLLNLGARAYRLLGCELTYHRSPPRVGETITYDIHVDGHANQGPIRLFFFHYDCRVRPTGSPLGAGEGEGEPLLTVRNGQAGFFTRAELDDSAGVLWTPEGQEIVKTPRLDAGPRPTARRAFTPAEIHAFADGDPLTCFGPGFERTRAHVQTPRIQGGRLVFLERVDELDPRGGPWARGYLRATTTIHEDDWFFPGHFHNDPCMPGTLMFEGCLQAMAFYLASQGVTIERDGWRFEPIPGETYKLLCRGQVVPTSKELVYEIFVEEFVAGPEPMLYADLLCTVDGLKAFHARRMGLRLVPDWPMESRPRLLSADALPPPPGHEPLTLPQNDPKYTVACAPNGPSQGFPFDYASLVACAWGKPSTAFGAMYERFDSPRKVARLPGPPYHFMSRVVEVDGPMGEARAGASVVVDYDVPKDAWYFAENGARVMPYAVLMEAALQPCGWLASYIGSALLPDEDVLFRNLDGKATVLSEVTPESGTLRTRAKLKSFSRSGTMIIVGFDVVCTQGDERVYELDTVFGFFPTTAFENQAGLPTSDAQRALLSAPELDPLEQVVLGKVADHDLRTTAPRLASPFLCMIDRIVHIDDRGGPKGLGALRAEKDVDPGEWFFKAHFFQDPVQPGSLGVEAMCQLLQSAMRLLGHVEGLERPRFEAVAVGAPHVWKYRGQVVPDNRVISCTLEVTEVVREEKSVLTRADASLWVDGKRIYDAKGLAMRAVSSDGDGERRGAAPGGASSTDAAPALLSGTAVGVPSPRAPELLLDVAREPWLADHAPTWVIPALPATAMLDHVITAASEHGPVAEVERLQIQRWITLPDQTARIRARATKLEETRVEVTLEAFREAKDPRLSRFEPAAVALVRLGEPAPVGPLMPPLERGEPQPDPYARGVLFHGPSFRLLRSWRLGATGATGILDAAAAGAPLGPAHPILLDAATHVIPHDAMHLWAPSVPEDRAAYPYRIERARFSGAAPTGRVRVEARFAGALDGGQVRVALQVIDEAQARVWAELDLVEVLLPKGPIGVAPPEARVAFLRDARFVRGVGLSAHAEGRTRLEVRDVAISSWLPGTVERVYAVPAGSDVLLEIAARDHVAALVETHPCRVTLEETGESPVARTSAEPFTRFPLRAVRDAGGITVESAGEPRRDFGAVRSFWRNLLGVGPWPGEDLHIALAERFVRRVQVVDPAAIAALRGRSVLFLGNHQVGIESLLFGVSASAILGTPTLTLAKNEHRASWLGRLIEHSFAWPGLTRSASVIAFFDRQDPSSLPRILGELAEKMKRPEGQSVMIHVEGTRARSCAQNVAKMSGVFVDLAQALSAPIVPVRFVGGLPRQESEERLEFPLGLGRQDYVIGAPILPETLAAMPYKERTERVMGAINALGPGADREAPLGGDPALEARAAEWRARGLTPPHAVIAAVLEEARGSIGPELGELVDALASGGAPEGVGVEGEWVATLAELMLGK